MTMAGSRNVMLALAILAVATGGAAAGAQRLPRTAAHPNWIGVGLVTADRAALHPEPQATGNRRTPYLVAWDAVAIIEERAEWVRVEYVGGERPTSVWLRRSDLAVAG